MLRPALGLMALLLLPEAAATAQTGRPITTVTLPGSPFGIAPTGDGQWVFVALTQPPAIAVLHPAANRINLVRTVSLDEPPTGIALTHDGQLLIAAAGPLVYFLDAGKLASGVSLPLVGAITDGANAGSVDVNVSPDDALAFVADENLQQLTVIDLNRARSNGFPASAIVGRIPTGEAPTQILLSADGQWLYVTGEAAPPAWGWPSACTQEGQTAIQTLVNPQGAITVANVARAAADPANSVVANAPAGCSPVRMAASPAADRLYVTARNNNAVLAFDTSRLISDPAHALLGSAPVGAAPVPVAVFEAGRLVLAGNSNRFQGPNTPSTLSLLDAAQIAMGGNALLSTIPAGAFPRTLVLSPDRKTLYLANYGSNSLEAIDVASIELAARPGSGNATLR